MAENTVKVGVFLKAERYACNRIQESEARIQEGTGFWLLTPSSWPSQDFPA